jgi:hypothetical protein
MITLKGNGRRAARKQAGGNDEIKHKIYVRRQRQGLGEGLFMPLISAECPRCA